METHIRLATDEDAAVVAQLVHKLLSELRQPGTPEPSLQTIEQNTHAILNGDTTVWAHLAEDSRANPLGVLTLNECTAIYAGGQFGVISELYVEPQARSSNVGQQLLHAATRFGRERQWGRLEVGAPSMPRWARTVAFYQSNGFEEVGPRLRHLLA